MLHIMHIRWDGIGVCNGSRVFNSETSSWAAVLESFSVFGVQTEFTVLPDGGTSLSCFGVLQDIVHIVSREMEENRHDAGKILCSVKDVENAHSGKTQVLIFELLYRVPVFIPSVCNWFRNFYFLLATWLV